jgi:hypothetical protein
MRAAGSGDVAMRWHRRKERQPQEGKPEATAFDGSYPA